MGHFWTFLTHFHSLVGLAVMLLYPLYVSVTAIESPSTGDDQQWLAHWILYSFLTLAEMVFHPLLEWDCLCKISIWYTVKLVFVAWLVLPYFRGAAFIYERFVREQIKKRGLVKSHHLDNKGPNGKAESKFADFLVQKKGEHEASS